jgi:hypothetical protein
VSDAKMLRRLAVTMAVGAVGLIFVPLLPIKGPNAIEAAYMLGLIPLMGLAAWVVGKYVSGAPEPDEAPLPTWAQRESRVQEAALRVLAEYDCYDGCGNPEDWREHPETAFEQALLDLEREVEP